MNSIIQKRTISPAKLDEVKIKANILSAFKAVVEKAEEIVEEAEQKVRDLAEREPTDEDFRAAGKREILARMLRNLLGAAQREEDIEGGMHYLDGIILLDPEAAYERFMRAGLFYFKDMKAEAMADVDWLLEHPSEEVDEGRVRQLQELLLQGVE